MTSRGAFMAGARLLGIYFALTALASVASSLLAWATGHPASSGMGANLWLVFAPPVITGGLGFLLFRHCEELADGLRWE